MNIKKSKLIKIIREEIQEVKLRNSIRGMVQELTGTAKTGGRTKLGRGQVSAKAKTAKSQEATADTAYKNAADRAKSMSSTYDTSKKTTATKKTAFDTATKTLKALKGKEFESRWTGPIKRGQPMPPTRYAANPLGPIEKG